MTTPATKDAWIEEWLSAGRFATYLQASGGSRERALALYEWNARLSAAFLRDLSHLEVGFRNACDAQLSAAVVSGDSHWTDDATLNTLFPVSMRWSPSSGRHEDTNKTPRDSVKRAVRKVTPPPAAPGAPQVRPLPGKIIAEIMFGFWTYLAADSHEKTIWVPYLHKAFSAGTDRDGINKALISLREFRNRVAHHENILNGSEAERRRIIYIIRRLSPDALAHLKAHSEVSNILAQRP